jgi:hypothetical protein
MLVTNSGQQAAGARRVKQRSNIIAFAMMLVVLVLGVFIASVPDLDDSDDNVGCAALMPLAPRKSIRDAESDERRLARSERSLQSASIQSKALVTKSEVSALGSPSLSQISPPLRA